MKNKFLKILPILFCIVISLVIFIPYLSTDYINNATDISYHLSRLEGLATSIKEGNFFPKIYPYKNNGYGYPWPVFYCDLFLIIPAIAYNLGFGLINSYKLAMYIPVLLTAINSYIAFNKTFESKSMPYIAVVCYACCSCFTNDIFFRSGLGSVWAWAFFPLVFTGAYNLLCKDENQAKWMLIVGFTGLALSHNISFFFGAVIFAFLLVCNIKRLFNFNRLKSLVIASLVSFGLAAYFLLPMLEFKLSQTFIMDQNYSFAAYKATYLELSGVIKNYLAWLLLAIISIMISYKINKDKKMLYFNLCLVALGIFLLLSSTKYINLPLTFTQFKSRLIPVAYLCFIYPIISISFFVDKYENNIIKLALAVMISLYVTKATGNNLKRVNEYEIKFSNNVTLEDVLYPLYVGYNSTIPELVIEPDVDWLYLPAAWNYNYMDTPCVVDFYTREAVTCDVEKLPRGGTL